MKPPSHIESNDTRCWCGPKHFMTEESQSEEIFPGIYVMKLIEHHIVIHLEQALAPRKHGKPRRPKHLAEIVHL